MEWTQSSYKQLEEQGGLYLVPTPIGNLGDITFRSLEILKKVNYIACEDTRQTVKLLNYYDIEKKLVSLHEHNQREKGPSIIEDIKQGQQVAYVTDAGMPAISDPGQHIAQLAIDQELAVIALPGSNAALTALIASGLNTDHFLFYGFLDRHVKKKRKALEDIQYIPYTLIFYEAPHRLKATLQLMEEIFGERSCALVREISKKHETYIRGDLSQILKKCMAEPIRGECCIVVSGHADQEAYQNEKLKDLAPHWWEKISLSEHIEHYIGLEHTSKEAIKCVAKDRQMSKRDVYQAYHVGK